TVCSTWRDALFDTLMVCTNGSQSEEIGNPNLRSLRTPLHDVMLPVCFEVRQHRRRPGVAAGPVDRDPFDLRLFRQAERQHRLALAQVAAGAGDLAALLVAADLQHDTRPDGVFVTPLPVALEGEPQRVMAGGVVVAEQPGRPAVDAQHDVEVAVAIDVEVGAAAADDRLEEIGPTGALGHQSE